MSRFRITLVGCAMAIAVIQAASVQAASFTEVLDTPVLQSPLLRSLRQGVTRAGDRIVAVGRRGHIVISSAGGAIWKQSPVPVSSDLTAVYWQAGESC